MEETSSKKHFLPRKVLVVEDDNGLRSLIVRSLNNSGFIAEGLPRGKEAIESMLADNKRIMLIDQRLPDMTGSEIVDTLKSSGLNVTFVMMTGQGDEKLAVQMMKLGAADYLVKEVGFTRLLPGILERIYQNLESQILLKEAEESNKLLEKEVEIAKKTLQFKQKFLASISHEIRTPLTGVIGVIELLEKTSLDESQKDLINTLRLSSANLREIIDQVLDYSKLEAGKVHLNNSLFSSNEIFSSAQRIFYGICRKPITLKTTIDPELPELVVADQKRIMQIMNNLIVNAVKFTKEGSIEVAGRLVEKLVDDKCMIEFAVADTGIGISEEDLSSLFSPFSQARDIESSSYGGAGLGLSICKELVELHGGIITAESKPGVGSTFRFSVEVGVPEDGAKEEQSASDKKRVPKPLKILLAEDKELNQKILKLLLNSLGHEVSIASNGAEVLDILPHDNFDLILMDIQMPVMDGITATQLLKEKFNNLPPIVGLSANAFEGDRERYMQLGMDEYLTKPIESEDFTKLIEKLAI